MLRVFHHYVSARKLALFLVEAAVLALTCVLGALLCAEWLAPVEARPPLVELLPAVLMPGAAFVTAVLLGHYLVNLYDLRQAVEDQARGLRLLRVVGSATAGVGVGMLLAPREWLGALPPGALLGAAMGALAGTLVVRASLRAVVGEPGRVLVLGTGPRARALVEMLALEGEDDFQVAAQVEPPGLGADESVDGVARRLGARYVVQAVEDMRGAELVAALLRCRMEGLRVYDVAGFSERVLRRIPIYYQRPSEFVYADGLAPPRARRVLKRLFDVVAASVLLLATAPLMMLVAVAIKLDSKGPVFYSQERTGLRGRTFRLWKFRSMGTDAERHGAVWAQANDMRVTRMGRIIRRLRVDEIPQAFNVLKGDMSFVGPRPERPVFVERLERLLPLYGLRHAVKPGITGWAQIRYPYGASVEDARHKLELDLYYVKNGTLFLDVAIIFHTMRHVLFGRGAR